MPSNGVFAVSELVPLVRQARDEMWARREEWLKLRTAADEAKALAKKTRADLVVYLRVWGLEATGGIPIKTSVERNEWSSADPDVQRTELAADLAQTVQMAAREAYNDAQAFFATLQSFAGMERDQLRAERHGD